MQTEIKASFTRDRINLGPIPDWVQIGFAFTRDLLEPVRCRPLTRHDVGPLEERSKYGPGPVQVSCKQARPIPLWICFAFHAQQPKCTYRCTFHILGGCQGRRTGVGVTTVSNSLILGGWVTKVLKNGDKK